MFVTIWQDFGWKLVNVNENSIFFNVQNHGSLEQDFMQEQCLYAVWGFFSTSFNNRFFKKEMETFQTNL